MDNRLLIIFINANEDWLSSFKEHFGNVDVPANAELIRFPINNRLKDAYCDKAVYISDDVVTDSINDSFNTSDGFHKYMAFVKAFSKGYSSVCMIEGCCFDLPPEIVDRAFNRLRDFEVVLGPTLEGGCYLLGMNQTQPQIFNRPAWADRLFIKDTIIDLKPSKLKVSLLPFQAEAISI